MLSQQQAYGACRTVARGSAANRCEFDQIDPPTMEVLDASVRVRQALVERLAPDALHASGLLDLAWSNGDEAVINRAINSLETSAALARAPAGSLTDLAAAYIVRASRRDPMPNLLLALSSAVGGTDADSTLAGAWFNRAIAAERLHLRADAHASWERAAHLARDSGWSREAAARALATMPVPARATERDSLPLSQWVRHFPAEARDRGFGVWMRDWGNNIARGDTVGATRALARARELAVILADSTGEPSLRDAVNAAATTASPRAVAALARAHVAYAEAQDAYFARDFDELDRASGRTLSDAPPGALRSWALVFHGIALIYKREGAEGMRVFDGIVHATSPARTPGIAARARWARGTALLREGRYDDAVRSLDSAARLFAQIGEREHLGAVLAIIGETWTYVGDPAAATQALVEALDALRPYEHSPWRHNALFVLARVAAGRGLSGAVSAIGEEDRRALRDGHREPDIVDAEVGRALARHALGDSSGARIAIDSATAALARMGSAPVRASLAADVELARGMVHLAEQPAAAAARAARGIAWFRPTGNLEKVIDAWLALGDAEEARGNQRAELGALDSAAALVEQTVRSQPTFWSRAGSWDTYTRVRARRTLKLVRAGRLRDGAEAMLPLGVLGEQGVRGPAMRSSPRTPLMVLAAVGDTLIHLLHQGDTACAAITTLPRADWARTLAGVNGALELGGSDAAANVGLVRLYDWLVRPLERACGHRIAGRVQVTSDGVLAAIPFAALRDTAASVYWVERVVPIVSFVGDAERHRAPPTAALFVVSPTLAPGAPTLPGARAEVDSVRKAYRHGTVLSGVHADASAVLNAAPRADLTHFALHAIDDPMSASRDALLLASGPLSAAALSDGALRTRGTVVLAACQTLGGGRRGEGPIRGLGSAFLQSGADAVVATLWRVPDQPTARLLRAFHTAFAATGDAASALRTAQLAAIHSPDARADASTWAAFVVLQR